MAMNRKRSTIRRPNKKRRFNMSGKRRMTPVSVNKILMKRRFYSSTWTFGTAATADFWKYFTFTVGSMPNVTEISNLFDLYKLNGVKVTFVPRYDEYSAGTSTAAGTPLHYAWVLIDPASTVSPSGAWGPTTLNGLIEDGKAKMIPLNKPFSIFIRPRSLIQYFGGGTASTLVKSAYNRTSDLAVDHRGFHMYITQNGWVQTAPNVTLDIYYTYYVSAKNLK